MFSRLRLRDVFVLVLSLGCGRGLGLLCATQRESASQNLTFDVASVKFNKSGDQRSSERWQPGGRFVASNLPLKSLLSVAYAVPLYQLDGLPDWVSSSRFDITAQAQQEPSLAERRLLLQSLLRDRFHVISKTESKEKDVYALILARSDRRLGPGLRPSSVECPTAPQAVAPIHT